MKPLSQFEKKKKLAPVWIVNPDTGECMEFDLNTFKTEKK